MSFVDRADAGRKLGMALVRYKDDQPVVVALVRGGVPVAAEVAAGLGAPLDCILVRKIGVPFQPELAMGAVADGEEPTIVRNEDVIRIARVSEAEFSETVDRELEEIERRRKLYLPGRQMQELSGRLTIIVDDGVATGATTRAALRSARKRGARKVVLAIPVAASDALEALRAEADEIVCLEDCSYLGGISQFYADFHQVSDQEVINTLARFSHGHS